MENLMHSPQIQHSSHRHPLRLSANLRLQNQPSISCAGCNLNISAGEPIYICSTDCDFYLHPSCSKFPELFKHPSHPHDLTLLPTAIYSTGAFRCNACALPGNRFNYHCHHCNFDLHVLCASKPLLVKHPFHGHPLRLSFPSRLTIFCNVCRSVVPSDQWGYCCGSCGFNVHLHCAPHPSMSTGHGQSGYHYRLPPQPPAPAVAAMMMGWVAGEVGIVASEMQQVGQDIADLSNL